MEGNTILEKLKEWSWVFILFAAGLAACTLIFPAVWRTDPVGMNYLIWIWALNRDSDGDFLINDDTFAVVGGAIESAVVIASVVFLVVVMLKLLKKKELNMLMKTFLLLSAIFLVVVPIGYAIGGVAWKDTFWQDYTAGFGFIAPFIASGIAWFYYTLLVILKK